MVNFISSISYELSLCYVFSWIPNLCYSIIQLMTRIYCIFCPSIVHNTLSKELCTGKFDCARNILYALLALPCVYFKYIDE